jgi:hypothetical protein
MKSISSFISGLEIGEAVRMDDLKIYPIISEVGSLESSMIDLDEATESGYVSVSEVSTSGRVPELKVINQSDFKVIIFDGEELLGAKQNRVINITVIVEPRSTVIIPVSCVEQGRWSRYSRKFCSSKAFMAPSLRQQKFSQVSASLGRGAGFSSDQGAIWEELSRKSARLGVRSRTGAMKDIFDRYHVADSELEKQFSHQKNQVGFLAFIRGGFAGGDIFATEKLSKRKFYKLVRSYQLDTLDRTVRFPEVSADAVFQHVKEGSAKSVESPGLGNELRFRGKEIEGSAILLEGKVAHVTLLPRIESDRSNRRFWPF